MFARFYSTKVKFENYGISVLKSHFPAENESRNFGSTTHQQHVAVTLFLKKVDLNDLKLCLTFHYNITGRSQRQILFFQCQGIGPARTWRSAATAQPWSVRAEQWRATPIWPIPKRNGYVDLHSTIGLHCLSPYGCTGERTRILSYLIIQLWKDTRFNTKACKAASIRRRAG